MSDLKFITNPDPAQFGTTVETFLQTLNNTTCILLEGQDKSRTRAFVTLLHGNEPSGAMALFRYIQSAQQPAVNILCIIASVPAALEPPLFTHRMLPRARDLNRCFHAPFEDSQGKLAKGILDILNQYQPEAVIDLHNTSGSGPSFGVATYMDPQHDALTSLFTQRLIITQLKLGALMEISEHLCPTVTIEVGGRLDDEAHLLAYEGLCRYFNEEQVLTTKDTSWPLELLFNPIRLELLEHTTLTYAESKSDHFDVTLTTDIEHLNFGGVTADTLLGWINETDVPLFSATDQYGKCALERLIRIEDGKLYPARPLKLFMITNCPEIASTDCLFYAVADNGGAL